MFASKARLVIHDMIAYQPSTKAGDDISPPASCQLLDDDEQVWKRIELPVAEEWMPVPLGWLEGKPVSQLIFYNASGRTVNGSYSTPEARAEELAKVVEFGVMEWVIGRVRPLQSCRFEPATPIFVRSQRGTAKLTITAVPGGPILALPSNPPPIEE